MVGPREVLELKVRERLPLTLKNVDGRPLGGAGARGPGAPIMNAKKHRRRAPGGVRAGGPGAPTINAKKH
jgi:hypothetical protein